MRSVLLILLCTVAAAKSAPAQRVLLADIPLAELGERSEFAKALHASQSGDAATARKELLTLTAFPETQVRLLAWNALRTLGVQPEANEAWIIRGVVVEAQVGAVAVYEDGRARWLDAKGGGAVWDSPGANKEVARLIKTILSTAEPPMKSTRPMPRADATPVGKDRVRLTVLTYAGFYVIDTHGSALNDEHPVSTPFRAATELAGLLNAKR